MERFGWHGGGAGSAGAGESVRSLREFSRWAAPARGVRPRQPSQGLLSADHAAGVDDAAAGPDDSEVGRGGARGTDVEDEQVRRQRVEAVLLLSRGPLPTRKLSQLAGLADATEARTLVRKLNQVYAERGRAFRAEEVAGGYQLLTHPRLASWLRRLGHIPETIQLTPPAMETLAIVAYRQPVLRADIEAIRGVACGEILRQLMERDLVRISGRSEELGRPYLYSTTKRFLQTFGLRGADALPAVDISEITEWSDAPAASDSKSDQHPVPGAPEEESDVSTAVAEVVLDHPARDEQQWSQNMDPAVAASPMPAAAIDDEEDEVFEDDADDADDIDEFDDDDDWDEEEDDEEAEEVEEEAEDVEAEWEEVDDEEDEEEWDEEEEDVDDEWEDDEEDLEDEDEDEEEWD